jgi:hypothetical protein
MAKIGEKIKIDNIDTIIVHMPNEKNAKIIYKDKGNGSWVSNFAVFTDGLWRFDDDNDYGRKLKDGEYSEFR